jgi:hypothetical protein
MIRQEYDNILYLIPSKKIRSHLKGTKFLIFASSSFKKEKYWTSLSDKIDTPFQQFIEPKNFAKISTKPCLCREIHENNARGIESEMYRCTMRIRVWTDIEIIEGELRPWGIREQEGGERDAKELRDEKRRERRWLFSLLLSAQRSEETVEKERSNLGLWSAERGKAEAQSRCDEKWCSKTRKATKRQKDAK